MELQHIEKAKRHAVCQQRGALHLNLQPGATASVAVHVPLHPIQTHTREG